MELRGTLSAKDVLAAQWLHIKPRPTYAVIGIVLVAAAVWALWFSFSFPSLRGNGWLLVGSLAALAAFGFWLPYKTVRTYRQRKGMQRQLRMEPTEAGLLAESETGQATVPWSDYLTWKEGNGAFLLYESDDMFHVVPKHFFQSQTDIAAFRDMLAAKVGKR
jgi:ABC-type nickel/cobalt efflux system permease component RcnA